LVPGGVPQVERVDAHPLGIQNVINTLIPEDIETARDRFECLWPVLLSTEQQTYQVTIYRHAQPPW
jgi:hypothetical protein